MYEDKPSQMELKVKNKTHVKPPNINLGKEHLRLV